MEQKGIPLNVCQSWHQPSMIADHLQELAIKLKEEMGSNKETIEKKKWA